LKRDPFKDALQEAEQPTLPEVSMLHDTSLFDAARQDRRDVLLSVQDVSKSFDGTPVLDRISLDVTRGEFLSLLGPSGCGKSTLLRLIAGFDAPDAGSLVLDGADLSGAPAAQRPVNTVFQSYALFPHLTVGQNIAFGLEMKRMTRLRIRARVDEMLELVQLPGAASRRVDQLSGGQQQRVALARALAPAPLLLLLDEPLSALDRKLRDAMQAELRALQRRTATTFIFVTHDQDEALALSDRVAVLDAGRIEQVATPQAIYHAPASAPVARFVGDTNLIAGAVAGNRFVATTGEELALAIRADGPALLAVKPADFVPSAHGLAVTVTDLSFGGEITTVLLRDAAGQSLSMRLRGTANLHAGQCIRVAVTAAHLLDTPK
jgi:ABC-type Fe3+/spermidine/putrescine transport system ATPase subunit